MAMSTMYAAGRPMTSPQGPLRKPTQKSVTEKVEDIYIAVMGVTGAGKSRFISACSGKDVKIGHSLESCTTEVDEYKFSWRGQNVHLIDTPGFDDTHRSDREVLEGIATWLATAYEQKIQLAGVLYLHRITDRRVGGTSLRNLIMFKKLCGDDFYPRVKLVTTMWDCVVESEAEEREKELVSKSDFWETMIKGGASTKRHWGTQESAMHILADVIGNRSVDAPKHLKVQSELVDEHKTLDQTSAGRQFEVELVKQREKHEKEIKEMKEEVQMLMDMNQQRAAAEIEKQRQMFEQRIAQSFEDQAKLKSSLDDIQKRQAAELLRMQEKVQADQAEYEEKIRKLEEERSQLSRMSSTTSEAQNLANRIQADAADIEESRRALDAQKETMGKKLQRYCIKGVDWVKKNPNLIGMMVKSGIKLVIIAAS